MEEVEEASPAAEAAASTVVLEGASTQAAEVVSVQVGDPCAEAGSAGGRIRRLRLE